MNISSFWKWVRKGKGCEGFACWNTPEHATSGGGGKSIFEARFSDFFTGCIGKKNLVPPFCLVFHLNSFPRYLSKSFCLYRVLGKYCPISILAHVSIYVVLSVVSSRENLCAQNILYACTFQIVHRNPAIVCLWWFYSYCIQTFIL